MTGLNVAIAGFGWWGQHMLRRLGASEIVRPVAVIETAPEAQEKVRAAGAQVVGFDAALADPAIDAVILTVPNALHEEMSVRAARAGKHVFCEKPLSLDPASARRIVDACAEAGVRLGIGHERRFEPALVRVAEMVRDGTLGTIMHAEAAFSHDKLIGVAPGDWRTRKATSPAGGMTATGIHLSDLFIWMFGPVHSVAAQVAARQLDWETGDTTAVQLGFAAGMSAQFQAILYTPHFIRLHVFGHLAHVEVRNSTHPDTPGGNAELVLTRTGEPPVRETYDWTDTVRANVEAWAASILTGADYVHRPDQMLHNIEVLAAVTRSGETGRVVEIAP
ncbi:MAG: Gfo/Idh/MocA family oxidoreductase [Rhodobacteraceae bacterium]|nr:Gfo/Idh/MocA family oxidoreductase [Paracoccaceae bacterium]